MIINFLIYGLLFASIIMVSYYCLPWITQKFREREEAKLKKTSKELDDMFIEMSPKKLRILSLAAVLGASIVGFVFFKLIGALVGAVAGFLFPVFATRFKRNARKTKFGKQLIDSIMVLNSSLKAGLSFNQAIEMVSRDMPPPISDEFSLVLREIGMGVSMEEALEHLDKRIDVEELKFVISAILVAREVGGNLPYVLNRLVVTLRDRFRLKENIKTYTVQGRAQGYIISFIPLVFLYIVLQRNPHHFDIMLTTDIGKFLLGLAVALNLIGIFLIIKWSQIKI